MKRIISSLNDMSFSLPEGWQVAKDKYNLINGQGFFNRENYLSCGGEVISLFEVHRQPDEFFEYYQALVESHDEKLNDVVLYREFSIKFGEYSFPVYILQGIKQPTIYMVQVFVNCTDRLGCFMFSINSAEGSNKDIIKNDKTFSALAQILRTIE